MKQLSTLIICISISTFCFSQDQTEESDDISSFFNEINNIDPNNVELMESANEKLFRLLEANPEVFVSSMAKTNPETTKRISKELKSPIHDGFDLLKIYSKVYKVKPDNNYRLLVLEALKEAAKKQGIVIKDE